MKVPLVTVLSPPKSIAQTAGSPVAVSLKIKHPLDVNEAEYEINRFLEYHYNKSSKYLLSASGMDFMSLRYH